MHDPGWGQTGAQTELEVAWNAWLKRLEWTGDWPLCFGGAPVLDFSRTAAPGTAHVCMSTQHWIARLHRVSLETVVGAVGVDRGLARYSFGGAPGFGFLLCVQCVSHRVLLTGAVL